jgi:hypothetical protein
MNNFPSCFRTGGGKAANRRPLLGLGKSSVVYAHALNRGGEGPAALSTAWGKPSPVGAGGLSALTGWPRTGRKVVRDGRGRYDQSGCRPGSPPVVSSWAAQDRFYPGRPN